MSRRHNSTRRIPPGESDARNPRNARFTPDSSKIQLAFEIHTPGFSLNEPVVHFINRVGGLLEIPLPAEIATAGEILSPRQDAFLHGDGEVY